MTKGIPHIDEYGQFLKVAGEPLLPAGALLWSARLFLLASVIIHITVVVQLAMLSAEARPVSYVKSKKKAASLPALWMMFSGSVIAGFIVFHILHFTTGTIQLGEFEHGYVYNNLRSSFSNPFVAGGYIFVMVVIGVHLNHGVWSMFQTLGIDNPDRNKFLRTASTAVTMAIILGFIAVPGFFLIWSDARSGELCPRPVDWPLSPLRTCFDTRSQNRHRTKPFLKVNNMLTLDPKIPVSPIEDAWTFHKNNNLRLVGPQEPPEIQGYCSGQRPRWCICCGLHGSNGLQRGMLLLPGFPSSRSQHRRSGWYQRITKIIGTTGTQPGDCFTTLKRAETTGPEKRTFIG